MEIDAAAISMLRNKLDKERQVFHETLVGGRASSYDEYRELSGVIRGLNIADMILQDLASNSKEPEDA